MAGNQWVQDPNDPNRMTYTDENGTVHVAVKDTGAKVERGKDGQVTDIKFPNYKPTDPAVPADSGVPVSKAVARRGWGDRFADSWKEAGQQGTVGVISRNGLYYSGYGKEQVAQMFPGLSPEEQDKKRWELITQTQKRMRDEAAARRKADPTWAPDRSFFEQVASGDWIPDLLGQMGGGFGPENAIAPGANAVQRVGAQGIIGGGANALSQGADINDSVADKFDISQVGMDALVSMAGQGVFELPGQLGKLADKITPRVNLDIVDGNGKALNLTPEQLDAGPPAGEVWRYRDPETNEWVNVESVVGRQAPERTPETYTIPPEERADIEAMVKNGASFEEIQAKYPNAAAGNNGAALQWYVNNNGKWQNIRWNNSEPKAEPSALPDDIVVQGDKEALDLQPSQAVGPNGETVEVLPERYDDGDGRSYREYRVRDAEGNVVSDGEIYDNGVITSNGEAPVDGNFIRFAAKGQESLDDLAPGQPVDPTVPSRDISQEPIDPELAAKFDEEFPAQAEPPKTSVSAHNPENFMEPTTSKSGRMVYETTGEAKGIRQIYAEYTPRGATEPLEIQLTIDGNGVATLNIATKKIDEASKHAGKLGSDNVREGLDEILREFPEITEIKGMRKPGDRQGRVEREQRIPPAAVKKLRERLASASDQTTPDPENAPIKDIQDDEAPVLDTETSNLYADIDTDDVVNRLTTALAGAKKATDEQIAKNTETRKEKFRAVGKARATTSGEQGLSAEMAQLKGEFPKVEREAVRGKFEQREVDALFDSVKNNPALSWGESIRARVALYKLLDGHPIQANEIALLGRIFPKDFVKSAMKARGKKQKFADFVGNALNLPRSLMSSFDLSAPFRQAWFVSTRKEFWKALPGMFKQAFSEKTFKGVMEEIRLRPNYERMERSGLHFGDLNNDLSMREEAFMSDYAEAIPGIGKIVRGSGRGFTGFLNKVRADVFDDLIKKAKAAGRDIDDPDFLKDLSGYINNATGRGSLGKFSQAGPLLNALFFSPRLISSRLALLNPYYYATLDPFVRKEAIKQLMATSAMATSVLTLATYGGLDVETDPRSTDFGKIRVGDTRYDVLGGFGQYLTFFGRMATNQTKTAAGQIKELGVGYNPETRLSILGKFGVNKASPIAGFVASYLRGKDPIGKPFEPGVNFTKAMVEAPEKGFVKTANEVLKDPFVQMFVPLFMQDVHEVLNEEGPEGLPKMIPSFFGVGVTTYNNGPSFDRLGQQNDKEGGVTDNTFYSGTEENKPVVEEIARLEKFAGKPLFAAVRKTDVKDFKMTDEQFYNYQYYAGSYIRESLKAEMQTEEWKTASDEGKVEIVKDIVKDQKANARDLLFPKQ